MSWRISRTVYGAPLSGKYVRIYANEQRNKDMRARNERRKRTATNKKGR